MTHRAVAATALAIAGLAWAAGPARAQAFDAAYAARLAGLQIGEARLSGSLAPGPYRVALRGTYGVLGFNGSFEASAEGRLSGGALPARFAARNRAMRARAVEVTFERGDAVATRFDPPPEDAATQARVPLRDVHRQDVVDPLSALLTGLLRASGRSGDCGGVARVFTGGARFDIALSPGPAGREGETVCAVRYTPLAGHRVDAPPPVSNIRVAFPDAPDPGGVRLPLRIEMQTRLGAAVIERIGRSASAARVD